MHARKNSRKNNLMDVFNRAIDMSDPIISNMSLSMRLSKINKKQIPRQVLFLLDQPSVSEAEEAEDSDDDATNEDINFVNNLDLISLETESDDSYISN